MGRTWDTIEFDARRSNNESTASTVPAEEETEGFACNSSSPVGDQGKGPSRVRLATEGEGEAPKLSSG